MREDYRKAKALDEIASAFEANLLAGEEPRIESYLESNPALDTSELLAELLAIEIEVLRVVVVRFATPLPDMKLL